VERKAERMRFIRSPEPDFSLRLPHWDDAYFETLDAPPGSFGSGGGFRGHTSCFFRASELLTTERKGRIRQSVSRWCYEKIPLEELCAKGAVMGLKAIDLLHEDEWEVPRRYGPVCSMGYGGGREIHSGMNRVENHTRFEAAFRKSIPRAAKLDVASVITFSGNQEGMSDEEGMKNTVAGMNRVKQIAEDHGVTICMELL
jgi:xylose isomerase-like TIM barrel protein